MAGNYTGYNYSPGVPGAGSGSASLKGGSGDAAPTKTPIDYRQNTNWDADPGSTAGLTLYSEVT